jgi:hypothetical protein
MPGSFAWCIHLPQHAAGHRAVGRASENLLCCLQHHFYCLPHHWLSMQALHPARQQATHHLMTEVADGTRNLLHSSSSMATFALAGVSTEPQSLASLGQQAMMTAG